MSQRLGSYPVSVSMPVGWGDVDSFQHVNNVAYARWQENARVSYLMRLGMAGWAKAEGVAPILGHLSIDYRRPVTFPDTVRLDATVTRIGTSSFHMAYRFWSEAQGAEVAEGEDVVVVVDARTGKSTPLPAKLRAAIHALEDAGVRAPPPEAVAT
jgi:acyl-CoA thioester hydrolase